MKKQAKKENPGGGEVRDVRPPLQPALDRSGLSARYLDRIFPHDPSSERSVYGRPHILRSWDLLPETSDEVLAERLRSWMPTMELLSNPGDFPLSTNWPILIGLMWECANRLDPSRPFGRKK